MIERLKSLRVWLLAAMLATAAVTLVGGNFIFDRLNAASERAADQAKALATARAIAARVHDGAGVPKLQELQQALPNDQIIVVRDGTTIFSGPSMASLPLELTVTAPFPGGKVIVRDHHAPAPGGLAQGTLVAGAIAVLIIGKPIGRAIETADQLAAGDFSARMGESGPEEFARLGRAFDSMAAQLQQADTEQRRFLADLAHEIATPISAVSGFAFALIDGSAQTATERAEAADIIVHESDRLQRLLDDVRSLNRLELADSARREQVNIDQLCAETAQRFRLAAQDAKVSLRVYTGHACVITDPRLIESVVDNFVSNAIRYTPPGGKAELRARRRRSAVIVAVRDTGIGIAPDHLERIFDRLYRVDEARDRATGGSGLGLSIARRAAQAIGGRIEVDSKPGAGSEFRLILPGSLNGNSTAKMRTNQKGGKAGPDWPSVPPTKPGSQAGSHQGGQETKRLQRAERHAQMLRERLIACRDSEAKAQAAVVEAREVAARAREATAAALRSRSDLAARIVEAAQPDL